GGIFKQYLSRLATDFRELPDAKQLANSFRGLMQGRTLDSEDTFDALLALGVIKGTYSGDAEVRCERYKACLPPRLPKGIERLIRILLETGNSELGTRSSG